MSTIAEKRGARSRMMRRSAALPAKAPLTISRPEMLVDGSDRQFRQLVHNLFGLLARHESVRAGHGARIGLVGIEYTVLISIRHLSAEEGDVSVNRVADHLHLSGAFVTTITNRLLKRGLIHKTTDPADRRRVRLEVSAKGSELLARLAPVQRRVNDLQFGCLTAKEFRFLLDITERLIESSERAVKLQAFLSDQPDSAAENVAFYDQASGAEKPARVKSR
ncbi:MarR family winged helix-turn-helix transcriptional regulator [Pseudorhodoplanes sp.]|uniref:MarR family winged helix-turn-helix transcriptional regulator n=1 Tax=Pseudorhodoplanes sp. TaxID=1934341 RepID=UPI003D0DF9E1